MSRSPLSRIILEVGPEDQCLAELMLLFAETPCFAPEVDLWGMSNDVGYGLSRKERGEVAREVRNYLVLKTCDAD